MDFPPLGTPAIACFLDETGVVAQDNYFAVGVLTVPEESDLPTLVSKYRQRIQWRGEWHFSEVNNQRLSIYKELVDILCAHESWSFFVTIANRSEFDVAAACGDRFIAYERIAAQTLTASMVHERQAVVLADEYSTPDSVRFEEDVRWTVNSRFSCNIIAGVIRITSHSHDLLQLSDVLTGGITYPNRVRVGRPGKRPSAKSRLSKYLMTKLAGRLNLEPFDPNWLDPQPRR